MKPKRNRTIQNGPSDDCLILSVKPDIAIPEQYNKIETIVICMLRITRAMHPYLYF